jgi:hypothetical protein
MMLMINASIAGLMLGTCSSPVQQDGAWYISPPYCCKKKRLPGLLLLQPHQLLLLLLLLLFVFVPTSAGTDDNGNFTYTTVNCDRPIGGWPAGGFNITLTATPGGVSGKLTSHLKMAYNSLLDQPAGLLPPLTITPAAATAATAHNDALCALGLGLLQDQQDCCHVLTSCSGSQISSDSNSSDGSH